MSAANPTCPPVGVWSALVVRGALEGVILPAFQRQSNAQVHVVFDPTTLLMQRIAEGERPAVIVSTTAALESLPETVVARASISSLVRTGIGIGAAAGAQRPSIGTVGELVDTLRSARSVAYSRTGQSGIYFTALLEKLGIAEEVKARATLLEKGFTGDAIVDGRADLAIQQVSELRFVPGVDVVGSLPEDVQHYTEFSVAIGSEFQQSEPVRDFAAFLTSAVAHRAYLAAGLTPASVSTSGLS
jgi:molybdate transport system substrate-binding protein